MPDFPEHDWRAGSPVAAVLDPSQTNIAIGGTEISIKSTFGHAITAPSARVVRITGRAILSSVEVTQIPEGA